jgi:hypothetical protein
VTLPVYFHWEFRTGAGGDFESLVGLLKARDSRDMPPEVGKRRMDISQPGFRIAPPPPPALELEGALRVLNAPTAEWLEATRKPFQAELKKVLDAPWQAMKAEGQEPLVAPPIYGCWQAARHTVNITPVLPALLTWLDELNLDPRHRAVAALGTQVVQTQQEQLMASAWEQLGEIERINQIHRQAQLGRAVNAVYHAKHFTQFSAETLLKVVASAQSRVVVSDGVSTPVLLSRRISQSAMPTRAVSATLRRLTSPRGVISTRFQTVGAVPTGLTVQAPFGGIVTMLNTATIVVPKKKEAGLVTIDQVSDNHSGFLAVQLKQTVRFERACNSLDTAAQLGDFKIVAEGFVPKLFLWTYRPWLQGDENENEGAFRSAAKGHLAYLGNVFKSDGVSLVPPSDLFDAKFDIKSKLLQSLNPENTIYSPPRRRWKPSAISHWRGCASPASNLFFLPPSLLKSLEGRPIEEVLFLRDEMANLAWAVERLTESPTERPLNRFEAYLEQKRRREPETAVKSSPASEALRYRLSTEIPDYWIPLMPTRIGQGLRLKLCSRRMARRKKLLQRDAS